MKPTVAGGSLDESSFVENWAGSCSTDSCVQDGKEDGVLNEPNGCYVGLDKHGNFARLFIADTGNNCVRIAQPDGTLTTPDFKGVPDVLETIR